MNWLLSLLLVAGLSVSVYAQPSDSRTLEDVAWIAGYWIGGTDDNPMEEIWTAPLGDNMMGMFREVDEGKSVFYEFMLIQQTDAGPALLLKHFNPGLIGWEDKDVAQRYPLAALKGRRAVFEHANRMTRLVYERFTEDSLTVTLEKVREGKETKQVFGYLLRQ